MRKDSVSNIALNICSIRAMRRLLACALCLCRALPLAAEADTTVYTIESVEVQVAEGGRTRPAAALREGGFVIGERVYGEAALAEYIAQKKRRLANNRALADVQIEYTLAPDAEGGYLARLVLSITDTRNFIILPEPKFSSNAGFEPALKIRDYNFLGALAPLKFDLGYSLDEFHLDDMSKGVYSAVVEADMPFRAFALDWNLRFLLSLAYTSGEPLSFGNITGIAVNLPYKLARFTLGVDQETRLGEEYYSFEKERHANIFEPVRYMTTRPYLRMRLPLAPAASPASRLGALFWTPELSARFVLPLAETELGARRGPVASFANTVGFDEVNWRGNFREGVMAEAALVNEYNNASGEWNNAFTLLGAGYLVFTDFFALASRGRYAMWFNPVGQFRDKNRLEAGNMLRGILDRSVVANRMLSFNLDLPLRILRFMPSEWFGIAKLRYFNVEFQLAPVLDMALVDGERLDAHGLPRHTLNFDVDSLLVSGGAELLVFPLAWRSIFLRFSIGWDLREAAGGAGLGASHEIFIGIGHHY